jgi:hypothetical protein
MVDVIVITILGLVSNAAVELVQRLHMEPLRSWNHDQKIKSNTSARIDAFIF